MLTRISIRNRHIGLLVILIIGFIVVGALAYDSLKAVQRSARATASTTDQKTLVGEIDGGLTNLLQGLDALQSAPLSQNYDYSVTLRMDELRAHFADLNLPRYPFLRQPANNFSQIDQSIQTTLIPELGKSPSPMLKDIAVQRADQVRSLQSDMQWAEQRLNTQIMEQNQATDQVVNQAFTRIMAALMVLGVVTVVALTTNMLSIESGIQQLTHGAHQLAYNQTGYKIEFPNSRRDEFTQLAEDFNMMASAISSQRISIQHYVRDLQLARAAAEDAAQRKSAYIANMSHELRAPLHIIMNYTQLIAEGEAGEVSDEQVEWLGKVIHSSQHLLAVINDVLDMARIEAGQLTVKLQLLDLVPVVKSLTSDAKALISEGNKPLAFEVSMPINMPPVYADPVRVRQVLLNLIANAVRFTDEGSIKLNFGTGIDTMTIAVEDTGIGIPQEKQADIFERFQQIDSGKKGGTGLGLAIARELVELQKGRIWVNSQPGRGSSFCFTLPLYKKRTTGTLAPVLPAPIEVKQTIP